MAAQYYRNICSRRGIGPDPEVARSSELFASPMTPSHAAMVAATTGSPASHYTNTAMGAEPSTNKTVRTVRSIGGHRRRSCDSSPSRSSDRSNDSPARRQAQSPKRHPPDLDMDATPVSRVSLESFFGVQESNVRQGSGALSDLEGEIFCSKPSSGGDQDDRNQPSATPSSPSRGKPIDASLRHNNCFTSARDYHSSGSNSNHTRNINSHNSHGSSHYSHYSNPYPYSLASDPEPGPGPSARLSWSAKKPPFQQQQQQQPQQRGQAHSDSSNNNNNDNSNNSNNSNNSTSALPRGSSSSLQEKHWPSGVGAGGSSAALDLSAWVSRAESLHSELIKQVAEAVLNDWKESTKAGVAMERPRTRQFPPVPSVTKISLPSPSSSKEDLVVAKRKSAFVHFRRGQAKFRPRGPPWVNGEGMQSGMGPSHSPNASVLGSFMNLDVLRSHSLPAYEEPSSGSGDGLWSESRVPSTPENDEEGLKQKAWSDPNLNADPSSSNNNFAGSNINNKNISSSDNHISSNNNASSTSLSGSAVNTVKNIGAACPSGSYNGESRSGSGPLSRSAECGRSPSRNHADCCCISGLLKREELDLPTTTKLENEGLPLRLKNMTQSSTFCALRAVVVLLNILFIGMRAHCDLQDRVANSLSNDLEQVCSDKSVAYWAEFICFLFFTFEAVVRMMSVGLVVFLFSGHFRLWNWFDFLILSLSFPHFAVQIWPNITFLFLFRAVHLLTLVPALERPLRKFRLTLMVIRKCIQPLVSTLLVLAYVIFCFSVWISYVIGFQLEWNAGSGESVTPALSTYFGGLPRTMMSLIMAVTNGIDWSELNAPLESLHPSFSMWMVAYVAIMVIGILNTVTALFVDEGMQISQMDRDVRVKEQIEFEESFVKELQLIFQEADTDRSGFLSWEEFEEHLKDERITLHLSTMDLDVSEAKTLFRILDYSSTGEVSVEDFVWGFMRLKGNAKSADLCTLLYEHRQMRGMMEDALVAIQARFQHLEAVMEWQQPTPISSRNGGLLDALPKQKRIFSSKTELTSGGLLSL